MADHHNYTVGSGAGYNSIRDFIKPIPKPRPASKKTAKKATKK